MLVLTGGRCWPELPSDRPEELCRLRCAWLWLRFSLEFERLAALGSRAHISLEGAPAWPDPAILVSWFPDWMDSLDWLGLAGSFQAACALGLFFSSLRVYLRQLARC